MGESSHEGWNGTRAPRKPLMEQVGGLGSTLAGRERWDPL
jgi:hypothetical protein